MAEHFNDFIQFAINEERAAAELYEKYAKEVKSPSTKQALLSMAVMERGHEAKLKKILDRGEGAETSSLPQPGSIEDMRISDFLVTPGLSENSDIQDVFIFAMKAEEKAYELYSKLSELDLDSQTKDLFAVLASEEKREKLSLEAEYESHFMKEN